MEQTATQVKIADPLPPEPSVYTPVSDASVKDYNGAMVRFGPGAEVADVKFASDFSTIQIFGLAVGVGVEDVLKLLKALGFTVSPSCVQLKSLGNDASPVAEVRVENPKFAKVAANKFEEDSKRGRHRGLSIRPVLVNVSTGSLGNKLRMSSVVCTWYAPSRVAWLQYRDARTASRAMEVLNANPKILNRKIQCSMQHPPPYMRGELIWSVQVGNLDVLTGASHFNRILTDDRPRKIVLGQPSHSVPDTEAANIVESLLRSKGDLESFQFYAIPGSVKLKAIATFMDRSQAVEAVRSLNNHKLEKLGKSKLFVAHLISVKFSVLNVIYESIVTDLGRLRADIWQSGHVHLKSYPSLDLAKPLTTIRLFGEDSKRVAEAKSALEKLLAGSVVMRDEIAVWDPFFATTPGLDYLNQSSSGHKLYIHRDIRKSRLLLYGGLENDQVAAQKSLIAKVESLQQLTHTIVLTSALLPKAMKGGWRRIRERFGEAASLDISHQPKTILIRGSAADFQLAKALLSQNHSATTEKEVLQDDNMCPVCWEEATEPLKMKCGHNYCKDCFSLQASSADDSSFPMRCCGAEGTCLRIFNLDELNTMLPPAAFEKLLATSFDMFVRTRPQDFQHCPTPDCPNIYRISTGGSVALCSACLTPICTTCSVISHDGMSCAEFKDLSSEGTKAFEKWKKKNDVRNCPKCSSPIQKSFGCNHMECFHCKTHICWFCMRVFDTSAECYSHMNSMHQQIYPDGGFGMGRAQRGILGLFE